MISYFMLTNERPSDGKPTTSSRSDFNIPPTDIHCGVYTQYVKVYKMITECGVVLPLQIVVDGDDDNDYNVYDVVVAAAAAAVSSEVDNDDVQDLRLPYVVSIDFWQYKVEVILKAIISMVM